MMIVDAPLQGERQPTPEPETGLFTPVPSRMFAKPLNEAICRRILQPMSLLYKRLRLLPTVSDGCRVGLPANERDDALFRNTLSGKA